MQILCLFLSFFCGIMGGFVTVRLIYFAAVKRLSKAYEKRKLKEKNRRLI